MKQTNIRPAHATDLKGDRALGAYWEDRFCELAARYARSFARLQLGEVAASWHRRPKRYLLPDIWILTAPGEHHEIKHKNPTSRGCYGLERYRFNSLWEFRSETKQATLYTIHDWALAGAASSRAEMPNRIADWRTVEFAVLQRNLARPIKGPSWQNGKKVETDIFYWPTTLWKPLASWWEPPQ